MLANPDYAIPEAYVFHNGNVSTAGKVAYLPIYMLMFVEKEKSAAEMIYRIDLSMLQEDRWILNMSCLEVRYGIGKQIGADKKENIWVAWTIAYSDSE